jgi:HD-GYP domain-containing protein (c-di-GMP phosphodiesterase class II)
MTTDRPYRRALPWDAAVQEIVAQAGRQFDPMLVAVFEAMEQRLRRISHELAERAA